MTITGLKGFYLSLQQARVWSLQGSDEQAYTVGCALHLSGVLDATVFLQAAQWVMDRQSILRTSFVRLPGMDRPVQVIHEQVAASWDIIDLAQLSTETQDAHMQRALALLQNERLDLEQASLFHLSLFRLAEERHVLALRCPALCADERTLCLFVTELCQTYARLVDGVSSPEEAEEPLQYVDVAAWQHEFLLEEEAEQQRHYWHQMDLADLTPMMDWPFFGEPEHEDLEISGGTHNTAFMPLELEIPIDARVLTRIKRHLERFQVSLDVYLLACWYVSWLKLQTTSKVLLGLACDGRWDEELHAAPGLYQRFVPLALDIPDHILFEQVLQLMQSYVARANEKQLAFSWEQVLSPDPAPIFPLSFAFERWPASLQAGALTCSLLTSWGWTEPFVLQLRARQSGERVHLALHYDDRRITHRQVTFLASCFRTLLTQVTEQPKIRVGALSLLSSAERARLLTDGSGETRTWPTQGLHQLFEQQVRRHPDQLAVLSQHEQLTYAELNERANRLAQVLRQRGVGPEVVVGLHLPRQGSMLVGLLGILKAGGAYLPLDPGSPPARLNQQLRESHSPLLLTQATQPVHLPDWPGQILILEELAQELAQASPLNRQASTNRDQLAYVMYTSGSTGVPKGVMVRQGSVVNYTLALCEQLGTEPGWQYATVSTLAADLGNTAIFCALASGGCVQVLDYETVTSGEAMARWAQQHPIDVLKIVPSHLSALLESERAQVFLPRRILVLGGEALSGQLVERVRQVGGRCQVYNHYGPTETTVGVLVNALDGEEWTPERVGIGHPIANTQAYVLDPSLQLVPPGVRGELYLGGEGLARGYIGQGAQTAERFVPHPYSQRSGERLYRTGDLVRARSDGTIEYLGRGDQQVKIRGYRVELGEIEAALERHPQVQSSVVLLQTERGEPQLVSYVTSRQRQPIEPDTLRRFLESQLPAYMIPAHCIWLEVLPLTPNGKVDRGALPSPEQAIEREQVPARPGGALEELLLGMWKDLLAVQVLGVHDNFFAVGGHSLLATRLIAQTRALLRVELQVQAVFEAPTVAEFAQRVEQALNRDEGIALPLLVADARPEKLPLSYAQQRLWFLEQLEPESTAYLLPSALHIKGTSAVQALERSVSSLIARHESLRTTFAEQDTGEPVQVIQPAGHVHLPLIDLQGLLQEQREEEARRLANQEAQHPCDLVRGPLLRLAVVRLQRDEHILLITLHHIITDGWSNSVFIRELTSLYRAYQAAAPSPLTPLPLQYADYALWQRQWLQGAVLEAQLDYWRRQLAHSTPLELPTDHPRPTIQTSRGARQGWLVPATVTEALRVLSQQQHVTLFMTLLASFQALLQRYSGQHDISVGTPIANRRHAEIEGVIGFFVNTLVLRSDLSGDPSFAELLQRVREVSLGAYAHQDVPFEQVVEALEPERDLSRSPLFQVLFALQNVPQEQSEVAGVQISTLSVEQTGSKFDLSLTVTETEQGLQCALQYSTALFESQTIIRLLGHWQTLLNGIIGNPQARLSQLPLLSAQEYTQVVETWSTSHTEAPQECCLHQIFEQQVLRAPDAIALVFQEQQLSYDILNRRANQLAHRLQKLGVGPERLVGISLERSPELVIAVLGVLKAGGVYVPLDPNMPSERLAFLLTDTQVEVVITQERWRERWSTTDKRLLLLDSKKTSLTFEEEDNLPSNSLPENGAYVIYTSGSTGQPKGVLIEHRALANYVLGMIELLGLDATSSAAMVQPLDVDSSVTVLYSTLCSGGRLHLISREQAIDPFELSHSFLCNPVDLLKIAPSHLAALLNARATHHILPQRWLVIGGEASQREWVQNLQTLAPHCKIFNHYGPTEATVGMLVYPVRDDDGLQVLPLGRPLPGTAAYILDEDLHPVPVNVPGELYIGGTCLARGYLSRPDITADRFVPHPFATVPGERLYKTGDRVRFLADGNIEYLGRLDEQIKVRGYRIEPGEIQAALTTHPGVLESLVLAREEASGEKRLVAYIVRRPGEALSGRELRVRLQERLPVHMHPDAYVFLEALPLTPHGKVDRRALPIPEAGEEGQNDPQAEESWSPIEELLAGVWNQVLRHKQVGQHDNFFALGGHSLLATQLIGQVRKLLGVEVPLRAIFEVPTLAGFAQRVEEVLRQEGRSAMPPLVVGERPEVLPLSHAQQRLWFLEQLEPESTTYLLPSALHIQGTLAVQVLEHSVSSLIARHESLRTTFAELDTGEPVQVIQPSGHVHLPVIDLQGLPQERREEEARRLASQEAQRPCDLVRGPLLRLAVVRLQRDEHILLITLHHIITDGWSTGIFVRELTSLYRAYQAGEPSPLTPLPLQYADYALWQRQGLQGAVLEAQQDYWRQQLAGCAPLELPTDHPRPAVQTYRGARQGWQVPATVTEALHALSQQQHVTLFMTLLASFQVLLMRYSGQHDISVGTPIANRQQAEIEGVIGFFVNTLVLRSNLSGDPGFVELLQRVREVCLGAYAHQDVPFEQVVEALEPERDLSRSPLFQVMFVLQNMPYEQPTEVAGVQLRSLAGESTSSKFDLTFTIAETPHGLSATLEYATDIFEQETVAGLLSHWHTLLLALIQQPQTPISQLPLLSADEREQLLTHWNATQRAYPQHLGIHELFEQQAAQTPDAIALVFEEEQLTYAEFNARANQLAHTLRHLGVSLEVPVGLYLERSPWLLLSILAILKAGGVYVPLDAASPQKRLALLLTDTRVALVLTQPSLRPQLPDQGVRLLDIEDVWQRLGVGEQPRENLGRPMLPGQLAYVMSTSGSTGQPQGVEVPHQAVVRLVKESTVARMRPEEIFLQLAPVSFDASTFEIWGALLNGARLVLCPSGQPSLEALSQIIRTYQIRVLWLTAALFHQMVEYELSTLATVPQILAGGDVLSRSHVQRVLERCPGTTLINGYGPTENTTFTCCYPMTSQTRLGSSVPIGTPIANTTVYLLDARLQPVPVGVVGELYIGGDGLARGYLRRPALTAERFVPDPVSGQVGACLYKTGDMARYRSDGTIEFLGRGDQQVKIRGYRVEMGEIEAVLGELPGIESCVVLAREDQPEEKRLVAYLVARAEGSLSSQAVQSYLQERLPAYMQPSAFVVLDELPLTPNGKVDRRALPAPEIMPEAEIGRFEEARTPLEELLRELWCQLLGRQQIGLSENFFELGGHSLLATQLTAQVRSMCDVDVPLRAVFEAPTVAEFAQRVEQALRRDEALAMPPLVVSPRPEVLPLSYAQQRLWFLEQLEPESTAYLLPSALHIQGTSAMQVLERSVSSLIARHESLRTTFAELDTGEPVQVIQPVGHVHLPVIDLQGLSQERREEEARRLASQEAQRPCDLVRGPLLRLAVIRLQRDEHILLITLHHIITDGWSTGIFVRELTSLYRSIQAGEPSPLIPLPLQYADYALWQRQWLQGQVLDAQLDYWRRHLAGSSPLALPTDHPRPAVQTYRGARQGWLVPATVTEALRALSRQQHVTLFMTLLASFQVLLQRYSGQHDISVGTPIANRRHVEIEGVIGFFVNTLALRSNLSGDPSFVELLQRVREVCLGAYAHQDVPFEQVVEALEPERDLSRSPLFQVVFRLQPQASQEEPGEVAGVQMRTLSIENHTSQLDLAFTITETEQGLRGAMQYNTDLFAAETIQRMLSHWQTLLEGVLQDPSRPIGSFPLLS
ncbi:MAG TPA: amino acid adenylation domain-containing protein, partial [Ktedonobacteraceae bacterium]|nr:amino acid adenylation domain-containing protein [Ktedonobacteraceae bacterium]